MQQFDIIVVFIELSKTNNWVGVKIPRPGYLDPHPWFQAKYVVFFFQTNGINSITRNEKKKKKNYSFHMKYLNNLMANDIY